MDDFNNTNETENTTNSGNYNSPNDKGYYSAGQQEPYNAYNGSVGYRPPNKGQGLGIAALVCGVLSILGFCCCPPVCIVFAILGIVFGVIKLRQGGQGKELAIAGIVTGVIGLILVIAIIIIYVLAISINPGYVNDMYQILEEIA